jgi:hypothetical protein
VGRSARWSGALVVVAVIMSTMACTSSPDTSRPVPTAAPSTVAPTVRAADAPIVAAYRSFMTAYVSTYDSANPALVGGDLAIYGGSGHGGLDPDLGQAQQARVKAIGRPSWTTPTVTVDAAHAQATLTNCFDPGTWKTVSMTTHEPAKPPTGSTIDKPRPAYPGEAAGKYTVVSTMAENGKGQWFVFAIVAHRSQPC